MPKGHFSEFSLIFQHIRKPLRVLSLKQDVDLCRFVLYNLRILCSKCPECIIEHPVKL